MNDNDFRYNEFDKKCYFNGDILKREDKTGDDRTPFHRDRDRILFSSAFRRLQGKTQIFEPNDYDIYRTRLTHTQEVSRIARSIANHIIVKAFGDKNELGKVQQPNTDKQCLPILRYLLPLVEAAGLAHDLGHPAFAHAGEEALNDCMREYGGFSSNAQSLRIITELIWKDEGKTKFLGMSPTRAFVDSIMKYKCLEPREDRKFLYSDQKEILKWVYDIQNDEDKVIDSCYYSSKPKHEWKKYQSLECQIMDLADDIAYAVHDLHDGVKLGFITCQKLKNVTEGQKDSHTEFTLHDISIKNAHIYECLDQSNKQLNNISTFCAGLIGEFIRSCELKERKEEGVPNLTSLNKNEITPRYKYEICLCKEKRQYLDSLKEAERILIINNAKVQQRNEGCKNIIRGLFEKLENHYIKRQLKTDDEMPELISSIFHDKMIDISDREKARIICDYIAGLTDRHACRLYSRFYSPNENSISDFL